MGRCVELDDEDKRRYEKNTKAINKMLNDVLDGILKQSVKNQFTSIRALVDWCEKLALGNEDEEE